MEKELFPGLATLHLGFQNFILTRHQEPQGNWLHVCFPKQRPPQIVYNNQKCAIIPHRSTKNYK